jgi:hypothetical protein
MKKTIVLACLIAIISSISFGQKGPQFDLKMGPEMKESRKETLSDIIAHDETGIYALKTKSKGMVFNPYMSSSAQTQYAVMGLKVTPKITLEHYNYDMRLTKSHELELKTNGKSRDYEFIIPVEDELYLFSSFRNKKQKKKYLFMQTINKKTLRPNKDLKKISGIPYKGGFKAKTGYYAFGRSSDASKYLVYYDMQTKKKAPDRFGFHIFDKQFNQIWEKKVILPYSDELFETVDLLVDNSGNVHILGKKYFEKRKEKRGGKPNYEYQVLSYNQNDKAPKKTKVKVDGKFITDMKITIDENMDIVCAGFYSSKKTYSITGSYFIKIDHETNNIIHENYDEFGLDFITAGMNERGKKKAKKRMEKGKSNDLYRFRLDDMIDREDGGVVLIGEQYYVRESTSTSSSGLTTTNYTFYYNDIIVVNISPEGIIERSDKIQKTQITSNDWGFYSSYSLAIVGNKMHFIFNDNPKNLNAKPGQKVERFKKSKDATVVLVTLEPDGTQIKKALFSRKETGIITRPKVCEQISGREIILFGQRKKSQRFASITFE